MRGNRRKDGKVSVCSQVIRISVSVSLNVRMFYGGHDGRLHHEKYSVHLLKLCAVAATSSRSPPTMASSGDIIHSSPLKVPVVEIVDLLSDDDSSIDEDVDQIPVCDALDIAKDEDDDQWETESFYEDALEGIGDEEFVDDGMQASQEHEYESPTNVSSLVEACSLEEAHAFRKRLRKVGEDQFIIETVESRTITAKKLCTAFGIKPPHFLDGAPDSAYYPLLGLGISRELSKRVKLPQYNTVDDAVSLLKNSKNIIVLTGAGVSLFLSLHCQPSPDMKARYQLASASPISAPKTQVSTQNSSTSASTTLKKSLTSPFFVKTPPSSTLSPRTYSPQQTNTPPPMLSSVSFRKRRNS